MRLKGKLIRKYKPALAMLLAILSVIGIVPIHALANAPPPIETGTFTARIYGEEVEVSEDGIAMVEIEGFSEPVEVEVPRYFYFDGEQIAINDDRIEDITPVVVTPSITPFDADEQTDPEPTVGLIISFSSELPANPVVGHIREEYIHPAYVTMNGTMVGSRRYVVRINGVSYEAFCADPTRRGPGNAGAVYELTGNDGSAFRTVLRYGFPINPGLTEGATQDGRSWNAYITRVAVAYVSNPNAAWGRIDGSTRSALDQRISGDGGASNKANSPAITVNGEADIQEFGVTALSPAFVLGNSRRSNCYRNPFRFGWA